MMNTETYHLDQNVRGRISKNLIDKKFLDKYYPKKYEAILPFSLLEYAGIGGKRIFLEITEPEETSLFTKAPSIGKIQNSLESQIKENLPEKYIKRRLEERLRNDKQYAWSFIEKCIEVLPNIYNLQIIPQLSWDRFSQMKWSKYISDKKLLPQIRKKIAQLVSKENLYILRHCANHLLNTSEFTNTNNEDTNIVHLIDIIEKVKVTPNMDIGDCELIHTAINGQPSPDYTNRRIVDCYTMDPQKEIKRRLILCLFYYKILECDPSIQYTFDPQYCGQIYILDKNGKKIEIISVKDYLPNKVLYKIESKDFETLCLLNK